MSHDPPGASTARLPPRVPREARVTRRSPAPWLSVAVLAACGSPPAVTAISPDTARPGARLAITGTGFDEDLGLVLRAGDTEVVVPASALGTTEAIADVPADLPPGTWQAVPRDGGREGVGVPLTVWTPATEPPCAKRHALRVETTRTRRAVAVHHVFADAPAERALYEASALASLSRTTEGPPDAPCHALWLHTTAGERVLLADDPDRDLAAEAAHLARVLDLPLTTPGG